jgi:N-acylneuraminate cytidylyltransferase
VPSSIKIFLTDVDGVLTDGGKYLSEKGDELKKFYIPDGMGLFLLKKLGIQTGIVTTENLNLIERRALGLKMDFLKMDVDDKLEAVQDICRGVGCSLAEVAYIGDDVNDYALLKAVGFAACPADAQPIIKALPGIRVLQNLGGRGAVREFINELVGEEALVKAWQN